MLEITIPDIGERYDEDKNEFLSPIKGQTIRLEHSLVSISKWEAKYKKHFLGNKKLTNEETLDYIKFMTITQNVNPELYNYIPITEQQKINDYLADTMTATTFQIHDKVANKGLNKITTSEEIYYLMMSYGIDMECQKWHINRLLTLIRVFNVKNAEGDKNNKMSKSEILASNAKVNAERRAEKRAKKGIKK